MERNPEVSAVVVVGAVVVGKVAAVVVVDMAAGAVVGAAAVVLCTREPAECTHSQGYMAAVDVPGIDTVATGERTDSWGCMVVVSETVLAVEDSADIPDVSVEAVAVVAPLAVLPVALLPAACMAVWVFAA